MDKSKKKIAAMFDEIAYRYDFLNHFLTLGIDKFWRRDVVRLVERQKPSRVLDVAAGSGDLTLALAKRIKNCEVVGVDISDGMLNVARAKCEKEQLSSRVKFENGDALSLQFDDNSFDALTVAFGVRNFENLEKGLTEMLRVVKSGGLIVILELSMPRSRVVRALYNLYFTKIVPLIGRITSKSDFAYTYLPLSVGNFMKGGEVIELLKKIGYSDTKLREEFFGVATIYYGYKK